MRLIGLMVCLLAGAATANSNDDFLNQAQDKMRDLNKALAGQTFTLPAAQERRVLQFEKQLMSQQALPQEQVPDVVYLVSFSIPKTALKPMMDEAHHFRLPVVINGLVNNDFRQTVSEIFELTKGNNKGGVEINPLVFSQYAINSVPALVVRCEKGVDVVRGNVIIKQALEEIARNGDCADKAKTLLGGGV